MCGIIGIISLKNTVKINSIKSAMVTMKNRGPDDEGAVAFDDKYRSNIYFGKDTPVEVQNNLCKTNKKLAPLEQNGRSYKLAFGHRRLSILDLSPSGHQPMSDERERYWIVFNGEVFNFKELRVELVRAGYNFSSNTDTEVILKAYMHWGNCCVKHFNGMFAFAIFDAAKKKIYLARDRVGIKPLYFFKNSETFVFASDIKALLSTKLFSPRVDMEGLYSNFAFGMTPRPKTSFVNVFAVKQATYLEINTENLNVAETTYWDVPTGIQEENMSKHEARELLEFELKKSIKLQLVSDVEVATFMSGGIDSTTVSAIASKFHPGIKAFTLVFDKTISEYDELEQATATAKMNEIHHAVTHINAEEVINNIDQMVLGYEEPYNHLAANFVISKIVSDGGIKVALNGLGGDELFAGYGYYKRLSDWKKYKNLIRTFSFIPKGINYKLDRLITLSRAKSTTDFYTFSSLKFNESQLASLFGSNRPVYGELRNTYKNIQGISDSIELMSYLDIKHYIGNHHVHRSDQFTMAHSVEGRFPFLDHKLIEASARIPSRLKIGGGVQKKVLRDVAKNYIHPSCLSMTKKGFGLPLERWFDNELDSMARNAIIGLKSRDMFSCKAINNVLEKGPVFQKWHLVMTELWLRKFVDKQYF